MSRRRGFVSSIAAMQRAAEQASRAQARALREMERLQKQRERERFANEKERLRLFHEEEAESRNQDLAEAIRQVSNLLSDAVGPDHRLQFERLITPFKRPEFHPGPLARAEESPKAENYRPRPLGFFGRLIPGGKARYQIALREARIRFDGDMAAYGERERSRQVALQAARVEHEEQVRKLEEKIARQNSEVNAIRANYEA